MTIMNFETIAIDHLATVSGGANDPPVPALCPHAPGTTGCADGQCSPGDVQYTIGSALDGARQRVGEAGQRVDQVRQRVGDMLGNLPSMNGIAQGTPQM